MSGRQDLISLVDTDAYRIRATQGDGDNLIVCFASIGKGFHLPPPDEFVGTILNLTGVRALFVSDTRRSWMNDPDFVRVLGNTVQEQIASRPTVSVTTLGLSLGAFSALVAPSLFRVNTAIALSPQYSVAPDVIPQENRWRFWTKKIKTYHRLTVEPFNDTTKYYVLHGLIDDHDHMERFPTAPNVRHFVYPDAKHAHIGNILKHRKLIEPLIRAAMSDNKREVSRLVRRTGGVWRGKYEAAAQET